MDTYFAERLSGRIAQLAELLKDELYTAEFCGKSQGRYIIDRDDLKTLLKVHRLTSDMMTALADECLDNQLLMIDLDGVFAFVELTSVQRWRKVPTRLIKHFTLQLDNQEDDDDEDEDDPDYLLKTSELTHDEDEDSEDPWA